MTWWWLWPAAGCVTVGLLWWARRSLLVVTVRGVSMAPAYRSGDRVLARRSRRSVQRGQVVVVNSRHHSESPMPLAPVVKRVGAVAGDPVPPSIPVLDSHVPPGKLVLLGDNPEASVDSRHYGYAHLEDIVGRVVRRLG